jgi:hypothetical protein
VRCRRIVAKSGMGPLESRKLNVWYCMSRMKIGVGLSFLFLERLNFFKTKFLIYQEKVGGDPWLTCFSSG